jgi:hypothetical protein
VQLAGIAATGNEIGNTGMGEGYAEKDCEGRQLKVILSVALTQQLRLAPRFVALLIHLAGRKAMTAEEGVSCRVCAFGNTFAEGGATGLSRPGRGSSTRAPGTSAVWARRRQRRCTAAVAVAAKAGSDIRQEIMTS